MAGYRFNSSVILSSVDKADRGIDRASGVLRHTTLCTISTLVAVFILHTLRHVGPVRGWCELLPASSVAPGLLLW
jgi:hypothetical protein